MNPLLLLIPVILLTLGCTVAETYHVRTDTYDYTFSLSLFDGDGALHVTCNPTPQDACTDPFYNGTIRLHRGDM